MALDACVKNVLCTLGVPVLQALDSLVTILQVEITAQLAAVAAAVIVLDITLIPVELAADAAQLVKDQFDVVHTLLPANIMNGCLDLGDIAQRMNDVSSTATAAIDDLLADTTRLLSVKAELEALQATLTLSQTKFTEFSDVIAECITEAGP